MKKFTKATQNQIVRFRFFFFNNCSYKKTCLKARLAGESEKFDVNEKVEKITRTSSPIASPEDLTGRSSQVTTKNRSRKSTGRKSKSEAPEEISQEKKSVESRVSDQISPVDEPEMRCGFNIRIAISDFKFFLKNDILTLFL